MARLRHSANPRPAVRLISTPANAEEYDMSAALEGVRFSDQTSALLDHAAAHGWRLEVGKPAAGGRPVTAYPPDKDSRPVRVTERGGKFNRPHYENLRREMYAAGLPPLPADGKTDAAPAADEAVVFTSPDGQELPAGTLTAALDRPDGHEVLQGVVAAIVKPADGVGPAEADLVGSLAAVAFDWARTFSADRITEVMEASNAADLEAALALAAENEATATRATAIIERREAELEQARADCAAALRRAEAAEARAAEAERVLAPLRAWVANPPAAS